MPLINYIGNRQESLSGNAGGFIRGNAPTPPPLSVEYLVVGGGGKGPNLTGGGGGGFLSGSTSIVFNSILNIEVGAGATLDDGGDSYISSSLISLITTGGNGGQSGQPQGNNPGGDITGTGGSAGGGGGGAAETGFPGTTNGVNPVSAGRGGNGLQWLNGNFYAGGGGGASGNPGVVNNSYGGDGGGGNGAGTPYDASITASVNTGGGAGGQNGNGGSGIVIIRYATSSVVPPYDNAISGGDLSISGGYAYRTFTSSSQLTYRY